MRNRRFPSYPDDTDYTTNSPSYYDDLARKQKLIEMLAKKIWEYEETLDLTLEDIEARVQERFSEWDGRIESFPDNVESLLQDWLSDGTLDYIINDTIFKWKADKDYVDDQFTEINDDLSSLNSEGNRRIKTINQTDYSKMFKSNNYTHAGIVKKDAQNIELFAQNNTEGVRYLLTKDPNDDFFKLGLGGFYQNTSTASIITKGTGWIKDNNNWYTTQVGDSFTIEYEGTGISLSHLFDYRGGLWDITFESEVKTITTFSPSDEYQGIKSTDFFHDNSKKKITGVFVGSDPANNHETPRGWLRDNPLIYGTMERNDLIELLHPTSNKEFAFTIQYDDDEPNLWHPEHNGIGVMFNHSFRVYVDGEPINFETLPLNEAVIGQYVSIQQVTDGFNHTGQIVLANYRIQHNIDRDGFIDFKGIMIPKQPLIITTGYPLMLAVNHEILTTVVSSYGNRKENDGDSSQYYFTDENGESRSVAFTTNVSGYGSYFAFATLDEATKTMRYGQDGTPSLSEATFFWQRPTVPKFYFQSLDNKQFNVNNEYKWSGKIGVGKHTQISYYL